MAKPLFHQRKKRRLWPWILILLVAAVLGWFFKVRALDSDDPLTTADIPDTPIPPITITPPPSPAQAEIDIIAQPQPAPEYSNPAPTAPPSSTQPTDTTALAAQQPPSPSNDDPGDDQAMQLFMQGRGAMQAREYLQARQLLSQAVAIGLPRDEEQQARDLLNQASDQWLFSRNVFDGDPYCQWYKVPSGDTISNIAKKYNVPKELIMRINGISDPRRLAAGQTIKVVQGPFNFIVRRGRYDLSVYIDHILVRTYPVGLGAPGRQTPAGLWRVSPGKKLINPAWTDPDTGEHYLPDDPRNPLGERWMSLEGIEGDAVGRTGFGIHGTIKPDEIGRAVSRGCIRLYNHDVEVLYDLATAGQTKVRVLE